jgi:small subunit ribosomal protein S6
MKEESVTLNTYETVFILPAEYALPKVDEFIEKLKAIITKASGETTLLDKWGRRRLSYPIKRHREGFYVFMMFKAPGSILADINQFFRVNEDVVRNIVCKALKAKPGSPTMSVPAPMMQAATIPFHRGPAPGHGPMGHGPAGHAPAAPGSAAPVAPAVPAPAAAAPVAVAAPAAVKEEASDRPAAPAPAQ